MSLKTYVFKKRSRDFFMPRPFEFIEIALPFVIDLSGINAVNYSATAFF